MNLHDETVTILQTITTPPDADGVAAPITAARVIEGCNVQQVATSEPVGADGLVTGRWRVSTTELYEWVRSTDHVLWPGGPPSPPGRPPWFEIEGFPQHFRSGAFDHTEFIITKQHGG